MRGVRAAASHWFDVMWVGVREFSGVRGAVCVALGCLGLVFMGCSTHVSRPPDFSNVLKCTPAPELCQACVGIGGPPTPKPGKEDIAVVIHVMSAGIDDATRESQFNPKRPWVLAYHQDALVKTVDVLGNAPDTPVEFWTPRMIGAIFGGNGKVNEIWNQYGIQLTLLDVENCAYSPRALRPDGQVRDSMPSPQTSTPWTGELFRSINRLFTAEHPRMLHVFLWWSVTEGDIDGVNWTGATTDSGNLVWGYSRSAARGGPAVWVGAYECLTPANEGMCAKVIAHEIGHALGLHHVDAESATGNLMYENPAKYYESPAKKGAALSGYQIQQAKREAREQFGAR